jgi:hypothetical protein
MNYMIAHTRRRADSRPPLSEAQKLTVEMVRLANDAACHTAHLNRLRRALKSRERQVRILRREPGARAALEAEIVQLAREEEDAARDMARSLSLLDRFIAHHGLPASADGLIARVLRLRREAGE